MSMQILIIDNYDSFVYNIVQIVRQIADVQVNVVRNDDDKLKNISGYDAIIISPGPDLPETAGMLMDVIQRYHASIPMLGICLGFQALAQFFGARLRNLPTPLHGHESTLKDVDLNDPLYRNLPQPIVVGHYHSWVVDCATLPTCLIATATDPDGNLMSFRHTTLPLYGVQFHPESIITTSGPTIIANFLASLKR
jgi:anthranilate synthase component 2